MADIDVEDDVNRHPPPQHCSICGKRLSRYNKLDRCFHHPDPREVQRQLAREARRQKLVRTPHPSVPPLPADEPASQDPQEEGLLQEKVVVTVCETFGVSRVTLEAGGRQEPVVRARHILMYLLYIDTALSYPAIGTLLGGRDHTTVIHGVSRITEGIRTDPDLQNLVRYLRSRYR